MGTPLFERLPRGVRLTAAGEVLLATVRKSMADMRAATSQIEHLKGQVRGTVRIGCAESVATDFIPRAISVYQQRHSGVQFEMTTGATEQLYKQLIADEIDLMLVHEVPVSEQLKILASLKQPLCAMMRPGHALAQRQSLRLADCQKYPLALTDTSFGSRRALDAIASKAGLRLEVSLQATTIQALKAYCRQTDAICFQFEIGTQREVESGDLVAIALSDKSLAQRSIALACRASRVLPIASQSFALTVEQLLVQFAA